MSRVLVEIEITLIIFIGVIFQCRCRVIYIIANGNSCQYHVIQRRSADSLSSDRLSENSDRIRGSKFDTWHPTNWLGYRIGRSYFSRYRMFTCDLHPSQWPRINGVDLVRWRGEIGGFFSSRILRSINVSWAGDSRGRTACNVKSATGGDRLIQTTTKTVGARGGYEILSNTYSVPGKPRRRSPEEFLIFREQCAGRKTDRVMALNLIRAPVYAGVLQMKFEYLKTIAFLKVIGIKLWRFQRWHCNTFR